MRAPSSDRRGPGLPSGRPQERAPGRRDFVRLARHEPSGLEAVTAQFTGHAYDMHHHDEWLVGVTHRGVQDFFCRGRRRRSTEGRVILIEPGERHDGQAPCEDGFRYSMLYLPQDWLRREIGGSDASVGFRETLADDNRLGAAIARTCRDVLTDAPRLAIEAARDEALLLLRRHLGCAARREPPLEPSGVADRAMEYLRAHFGAPIGLDELAREAGAADRFQLARAFRKRFGASPHAVQVGLRLASARALIRLQTPLAEAALASGFADQSHMGRWFRRAFGLTPAAYQRGRTNVPDGLDLID